MKISLIIYNAVSNIVARLEVIRLCRPKDFPEPFFMLLRAVAK